MSDSPPPPGSDDVQWPDDFERLHGRLTRYAFGICARRRCDRVDGEEHAAMALADLWQRRYTLTFQAFPPLANYFARTLATVHHREARKSLRRDLRNDLEDLPGRQEANPKEGSSFTDMIAKLPNETERRILTLHIVEGMTFREIGESLGLSKSTVFQHYRNAIEQLRQFHRGEAS